MCSVSTIESIRIKWNEIVLPKINVGNYRCKETSIDIRIQLCCVKLNFDADHVDKDVFKCFYITDLMFQIEFFSKFLSCNKNSFLSLFAYSLQILAFIHKSNQNITHMDRTKA